LCNKIRANIFLTDVTRGEDDDPKAEALDMVAVKEAVDSALE